MWLPQMNYLAVLVAGVAIFILGALWYSPLLFSKPWVRLMGISEEQARGAKPNPVMFLLAFVCALLIAASLAVVVRHFPPVTPMRGAQVGAFCWVGFAGATSYANVIFAKKPLQLWMIDTGYNLVSFIMAGLILAAWR